MDGSLADNILPWKSGEPKNDSYRLCAKFSGGKKELTEDWCHREFRYICKKGPSACGARWKCHEGWLRRGDKCYFVKYGGFHFAEAVSDCKRKEASIIAINSQGESDWIISVFKDIRWHGQYYWRNYWLGNEQLLQTCFKSLYFGLQISTPTHRNGATARRCLTRETGVMVSLPDMPTEPCSWGPTITAGKKNRALIPTVRRLTFVRRTP